MALSNLVEFTGAWEMPVACLVCVAALTVSRDGSRPGAAALLAVAAVLCGLTIGSARIEAIGNGALTGREGSEMTVEGFLTAPPRRSAGEWRLFLGTDRGRVMVEAGRIPDGISTGSRVATTGTLGNPSGWLSEYMEIRGVSMALDSPEVELLEGRREGLAGIIDTIRGRAEAALGRGIGAPEAALARGFVLGQDQAIEPPVVDAFRASGLAHLLAVSGQNILLLAILSGFVMSALGVPLRIRLIVVIGLIALYVPIAGAGPSIQRAGIMGVAAIAATAAARPVMRSWVLALAATLTLALNPASLFDPGWQLSFAAVAGIMLFARPLAEAISDRLPGSGSGLGATLADAIAVTTAAAVSTLPLIAFHFERVPATTLGANLVAMPAVAPAMWLGMSAAVVGQVHETLALPFNLLNAVLLSFISRVAAIAGGDGATIETPGITLILLAVGTVLVVLCLRLLLRFPRVLLALLVVAILVPAILLVEGDRRDLGTPPPGGIRIEMLDIGQGDAFLLRSASGRSLLVDTGPPGGGVGEAVASSGIERLDAVLLTHLDLDHIGGFGEVLDRFEVESVFFQELDPPLRMAIGREGATARHLSAGDRLDLDPGLITVLSPPAAVEATADRNARSIVLLVEALGFRTLLTADAENEAVSLRPGALDVLKLAHHGSRDEGLGDLLSATLPAIGLISAGDGNRYGHPDPSTVEALEQAGVRIYRTDLDGTVSIVISDTGLSVEKGR